MGRGMILVMHVQLALCLKQNRYKKKKNGTQGMKYDELLHE